MAPFDYSILADSDLAFAGVSSSRALLCEILAMKLINHFANSRIQLVSVLTTPYSPLMGASPAVLEEVKGLMGGSAHGLDDDPQSALEVGSISAELHLE